MKNLALSISYIFLLVSLVSGCGSSNSPEEVPQVGKISLDITDAPVDEAHEVVIVFEAIEIKPQDGPSFTIAYDEPQSINLLPLQNGVTVSLLQDESLEAGNYNWIRLMVDADRYEVDSYITFVEETHVDYQKYSLYIPSGSNTGLKLNRPFTITAGG